MTRLTPDQVRQIQRLRKAGMTLDAVAREVGCHLTTVVYHAGRKERPDWTAWSLPKGFTLKDREEIAAGIARDETFTSIAKRIRFCISSVSKEVQKNGGRDAYRPLEAHHQAFVVPDARRRSGTRTVC